MKTTITSLLKREEWDFSDLPFPNIPDVHLVPHFKKADGATAIMPHPTSWWWQKRGEIEKYTTNKVSYLPFALLSGGLWDGMVVMGYDPDHYFYQNLWFSVLNEGYRMTPVAELDGGYEPGTEFYYGSMRTYYGVEDGLSMSGISEAVREGRTFVTSGPMAFLDIDSQFQIGDVVPADEEIRELNITALSSGEKDDYLSYVLVIRNGEILKLWDLRKDKLRKSELNLEISETEDAWYVVKVYGRTAPGDTALLDVMSVCEKISDGSLGKAVSQENNIFLSSPFYFRTGDLVEPEPLRSEVRLSVVKPDSSNPVEKGIVSILTLDGLRQTIPLQRGRAEFEMPVNGLLRIEADGYPTIHRSLYLDYKRHRDLLEELASGRWLNRNDWKEILAPGQVPWDAFRFEEVRQVLSTAKWTLELKENERDPLWEPFFKIFESEEWASQGSVN